MWQGIPRGISPQTNAGKRRSGCCNSSILATVLDRRLPFAFWSIGIRITFLFKWFQLLPNLQWRVKNMKITQRKIILIYYLFPCNIIVPIKIRVSDSKPKLRYFSQIYINLSMKTSFSQTISDIFYDMFSLDFKECQNFGESSSSWCLLIKS